MSKPISKGATKGVTYHARYRCAHCNERLYEAPLDSTARERGAAVSQALYMHGCEAQKGAKNG